MDTCLPRSRIAALYVSLNFSFFYFLETSIRLSSVTIEVCIPSRGEQRLIISHIYASICSIYFLDISHSEVRQWNLEIVLNSIFGSYQCWIFLKYLLAIFMFFFSFENPLLNVLAHSLIGRFVVLVLKLCCFYIF